MSTFGIALVWCAVQITIVSLVAIAADMLLKRRGRVGGSTILVTGLCGALLLTAIVWSPWPRWSWNQLNNSDTTDSTTLAASNVDEVTTPTGIVASTDDSISTTTETAIAASTSAPGSEPQGFDWSMSTWTGGMSELWQGWQSELNRTAAVVEQPAAPVWPMWVGIIATCGIGVSVIRLLLGWRAIQRDRRTSRAIDSPQLAELCDLLRAELSITRPVQLRESPYMATAATIGWKQPVILLPLDWVTWEATELRAVLAHELGHISRRHFPAWLMAQVTLALHFYHPCMHWIVGRLRLAQELEADEDAALVNGGRQSYLESLAALAIRQADVPVSWPARAFLPTRRTFLRRIEMLRSKRPLGAPSAVMSFIACGLVLAGVTFAAGVRDDVSQVAANTDAGNSQLDDNQNAPIIGTPIGIPGPPQLAQVTPSGRQGVAEANADGPIVLSHIPGDAVVVAAIRPAKLMQMLEENVDFAPTLAVLNQVAESDREQMMRLFLRAEQITLTMTPAGFGPNLPEPPFAVTLQFLIASDLEAFWENVQAEEVTNFANTSYRGGREKFWQIDDRTVMVGSEQMIRAAILSGPRVRSDMLQSDEWAASAAVSHAMVAIDVEFAARALPVDMSPMLVPFTPIWEETESLISSVAFVDSSVETVTVLTCSNEDGAIQVKDTMQAVFTLARNSLDGYRRQIARMGTGGPEAEFQTWFATILGLQEDFFDSLELVADGDTVTMTAAYEIDPSMYAVLFQGVVQAQAAAVQAQQQNNLKQIGLALHNYHDTYNHFPPAVVIDRESGVSRSWRVEILPFIEGAQLYEQYQKDEPWDSEANQRVMEQMPPVFAPLVMRTDVAPMDHHTGILAIVGDGAGFAAEGRQGEGGLSMRDFLDGTSNTIIVVESPDELVPWTKPDDLEVTLTGDEIDLGGLAGKEFNTIFCDGSVRMLPAALPEQTLNILMGRNDGMVVPPITLIHGGADGVVTESYLVPTDTAIPFLPQERQLTPDEVDDLRGADEATSESAVEVERE